MKRIIKYFSLSVILAVAFSCAEQSPTELLLDDSELASEEYEVEVIADNPDDLSSENGYDSTGVISVPSDRGALITLSGVKHSFEHFTIHKFFGAAVFYDKSHPVFSPGGMRLGYRTNAIGTVFFNSDKAKRLPLIAKFNHMGIKKDTVLGAFFALGKHISRFGSGTQNPYNSKVQFRYFDLNGEKNKLDIPTPKEITAAIISESKPGDENFKLTVKWNGTGEGKVEIIIGGIKHGDKSSRPLYRINVKDKGKFKLKKELLAKIPYDKFDKLVLTVLRRKIKKGTTSENSSDYLITAQSIHNLYFPLN